MSVSTLPPAAVRPAVFPPPAAPTYFADGDRYEWPHNGDAWVRSNGGDWVPVPDGGSGFLHDVEVSMRLRQAAQRWETRDRFVPVTPRTTMNLPGRYYYNAQQLNRQLLAHVSPARSAAQYVYSQAHDSLVPLRELVAEHDEDVAYDVPGTISTLGMLDLLELILTEHTDAEVAFDDTAGRVYARYGRTDDESQGTPAARVTCWHALQVTCLHVFVLSASGVRA